MNVVMGATGHIGSALADALLDRGEPVTVVVRRPADAAAWEAKGAVAVQADLEDGDALQNVFRRGRRAFLLNPPADVSGDTDAGELHTIARILAAVDGSGLEKVVAASTYGARPGSGVGDLTTLWELEQGLARQPIAAAINRGAYYMSNWESALGTIVEGGMLSTMFPADTEIPMVAPADLGRAAADRLLSPLSDVGVTFIEGPRRYTPQDVADAFSRALGRRVELKVIPREDWKAAFKGMGFSDAAAGNYTRMTEASLDGDFAKPADPVRGETTLEDYIAEFVERERRSAPVPASPGADGG